MLQALVFNCELKGRGFEVDSIPAVPLRTKNMIDKQHGQKFINFSLGKETQDTLSPLKEKHIYFPSFNSFFISNVERKIAEDSCVLSSIYDQISAS